MSEQHVICIEDKAFYSLVREVVERLKKETGLVVNDWIAEPEAMQLLNISSKTTLQKFRNEGLIRFSKTTSKSLLYFRPSILEYIEKNAKETFQ